METSIVTSISLSLETLFNSWIRTELQKETNTYSCSVLQQRKLIVFFTTCYLFCQLQLKTDEKFNIIKIISQQVVDNNFFMNLWEAIINQSISNFTMIKVMVTRESQITTQIVFNNQSNNNTTEMKPRQKNLKNLQNCNYRM